MTLVISGRCRPETPEWRVRCISTMLADEERCRATFFDSEHWRNITESVWRTFPSIIVSVKIQFNSSEYFRKIPTSPEDNIFSLDPSYLNVSQKPPIQFHCKIFELEYLSHPWINAFHITQMFSLKLIV